jgi:hypothetical protein
MDVQRDIGRLEAEQKAQDDRLERIEEKLDQLVDAVAQSKGGIRMLIAVGSVAATIAGLVGAAVAKLWGHGA